MDTYEQIRKRLGDDITTYLDETVLEYQTKGMEFGAMITPIIGATISYVSCFMNTKKVITRKEFLRGFTVFSLGLLIPDSVLSGWLNQDRGVINLEYELTMKYPDKAADIQKYLQFKKASN